MTKRPGSTQPGQRCSDQGHEDRISTRCPAQRCWAMWQLAMVLGHEKDLLHRMTITRSTTSPRGATGRQAAQSPSAPDVSMPRARPGCPSGRPRAPARASRRTRPGRSQRPPRSSPRGANPAVRSRGPRLRRGPSAARRAGAPVRRQPGLVAGQGGRGPDARDHVPPQAARRGGAGRPDEQEARPGHDDDEHEASDEVLHGHP